MSEYDLFKELSELDEELVMKPRKHLSLGMNFFLCVVAANLNKLVPCGTQLLSGMVFFCIFTFLYGGATWFINRDRKQKLLIEDHK